MTKKEVMISLDADPGNSHFKGYGYTMTETHPTKSQS